MMKWLHIFVMTLAATAVGLAVTLFAATASAQTPTPGQLDLVALGQQQIDALNAGNLDAAMAFFTADVVWQGTGGCLDAPCVGTAAVRAEWATFVADHLRVTVTSSQVSGNTVTGRLEAASDDIRAAGVARVVLSYTLEWRGDKIASVHLLIDATDAQTATFLAYYAAQMLVTLGQQQVDALNAGNLDAAMAFFTADAVWQGTPGCLAAPCVGTAAVRAEWATFVADHLRITVISSQVSGNTGTGVIEAASDSIRAAGVQRVRLSFTEEWRGDKIASVHLVIDATDPQTATFLAYYAAQAQLPSTGTGGSVSGGSVTGWALAAAVLAAAGLLATTAGGLAFARRRRS